MPHPLIESLVVKFANVDAVIPGKLLLPQISPGLVLAMGADQEIIGTIVTLNELEALKQVSVEAFPDHIVLRDGNADIFANFLRAVGVLLGPGSSNLIEMIGEGGTSDAESKIKMSGSVNPLETLWELGKRGLTNVDEPAWFFISTVVNGTDRIDAIKIDPDGAVYFSGDTWFRDAAGDPIGRIGMVVAYPAGDGNYDGLIIETPDPSAPILFAMNGTLLGRWFDTDLTLYTSLELPFDPVNDLSAATKQYVDAAGIGSSLSKGTFAIGNGVDAGSVTGLGLSFTPTSVQLTVRKPSGGLTMFASSVDGTLDTDGFDFDLSGLTDSANYKLDYLLLP